MAFDEPNGSFVYVSARPSRRPDGAGVNSQPGADLTFRDLTMAYLAGSLLTNANLTNANLTDADFFTGSIEFYLVSLGLTTNLSGANLSQANLTNANFSGMEVFGPEGEFYPYLGANLDGANLSGADTRGANFYLATANGTNFSNMIWSNGHIRGLDLLAGASLVVRDHDAAPVSVPIVVEQYLTMDATSTLKLVFDDDAWDSTISVAPGVSVARGGTLELAFSPNFDLAGQIGRSFDLFDWAGVTPAGTFAISSPLSNLYTTGEVTLVAVPALPGNYNDDGTVNAADYVVWRDGGSPDDTIGGYNVWKANFGQTAGSGAITDAEVAIPEPASLAVFLVGLIAMFRFRRRSS